MKQTAVENCGKKKPNTNPLKINFETMEVTLGNVSYGKIKGLIVGNDKITQTITISDQYYNETFKSEKIETKQVERIPCPQCQGGGCPFCQGYGNILKL